MGQRYTLSSNTAASRALRPGSTRLPLKHHTRQLKPTATVLDTASAATSKPGPSRDAAIQILKVAAKDGGVPAISVAEAIRVLEKQKFQVEDWKATVGGEGSPGRSWKLVYTSGARNAQKVLGGFTRGNGAYVPLTSVQRWDASKSELQTGLYLGHIAAITFHGPFEMDGKRLNFDIKRIGVKIGPFQKAFAVPADFGNRKDGPHKGIRPFFMFAYADDDICVARGRGGGIALWSRSLPSWNLEAGVL